MPWPDWKQAAVTTVVLLVVGVVAGRTRTRHATGIRAGAHETALVAFLYMIWRLARQLPLVQDEGAERRGVQLWHLQRRLHLPSELTMERFLLHHRWLAEVASVFYATVHVPALIGFLIWLYVRHKPAYPRWRNVLAITTAFCLFIRFIRVAPPRLLPDLGFVDVSYVLHKSVYGPPGTGVSDQYAAMPSIHIAWAAIVCFGAWEAAPRRWRWIGPLHLTLTFLAVTATANHWWMDGIVAVALMGVAIAIDAGARRLAGRWRQRSAEPPQDFLPAPAD
jgi:hypothetical protein